MKATQPMPHMNDIKDCVYFHHLKNIQEENCDKDP